MGLRGPYVAAAASKVRYFTKLLQYRNKTGPAKGPAANLRS